MSEKEIHTKETFQVLGMSCAVCALNVETTLGAQEGVYEAKVNFAASTVLVDYNPRVVTPVELQKAVEAAGYDLVVENTEDTDQADRLQREEFLALKRKTIGAIVLAIPGFVIGMFFMHMPYGNWIMLAFTIPVMALFGRGFFVHAYMQLKHGRANMDTLVAVSTGVAFLFSLFNTIWPEYWTSRGLEAHVYYEAAAVIIALILLGRLLEAKAKFSTSTAIKKLMGLQPKTVTKILADGSEEEVPIREVAVGDILVVKPGEKIPVDGEVTEGSSFVDESMITRESLPVEKVKGQPVYAGTINEKGSFRFRADKVGGETVLANIIRMVQEAQGSKAPVQKLVDRIAGIFVPVVMASKNLSIWPIPESVVNGRCLWQTGGKPLSNSLFDSMTDFPSCSMAKNPKIELPLRNDFGILCDPKIVPNTNLDTVCFTLPIIYELSGLIFIV